MEYAFTVILQERLFWTVRNAWLDQLNLKIIEIDPLEAELREAAIIWDGTMCIGRKIHVKPRTDAYGFVVRHSFIDIVHDNSYVMHSRKYSRHYDLRA